MKTALFCLLTILLPVSAFAIAAQSTAIPHPFFFTENKGQWDSRVLYKCNARNGMTWFLERDGLTLLTMKENRTKAPIVDPSERDLPEMLRRHPARYPMKSHALKFKFLSVERNSFRSPENQQNNGRNEFRPTVSFHTEAQSIEASGELPWHNNYFLGNDSSKWAPNCRNYTNIVYKDVWDGIDIEWYEENGKLEFDFVVQPGADPSQIRMSCDGLTGDLSLEGRGELHSPQSKGRMQYAPTDGKELRLPTSLGELRTVLPNVYQIEANGCRTDVPAKFEISNKNEFGVTLPDGYQKEHTLRIDPLIYSTFLGGSSDDYGDGIVSDGSGGVIVTGGTASTNFPTTPGAGQDSNSGSDDCFITRLNSTGSQLLYSTYLGGSAFDNGYGIANDGMGGVIVTGQTESGNFPRTTGNYHGGSECFVSRLNDTGSELIFSTLLGGSGYDYGRAVVCDGSGGAIVTGGTVSTNFQTTVDAYDTTYNGTTFAYFGDCFVSHLNSAGALLYSTYLGGSGGDVGYGIVKDNFGGVFVTGWTSSRNFPITSDAYDTSFNGSSDCFVTHLNSTGSQLLYSTFLGGSGDDTGLNIVLEENGGVAVSGFTSSSNFPTATSAYDTSFNGNYDCFVTRLDSSGSQLLYSTFLGGTTDDGVVACVKDNNGDFVITGITSGNFPTTIDAYAYSYNGGIRDCFVARLDSTCSQLLYSTYLGSSGDDQVGGIVTDNVGGVIVTGWTTGANFPTTTSAYDTSYNGSGSVGFGDCFVACINFDSTDLAREEVYTYPQEYSLKQNYPNPFNSTSIIEYSLPKRSLVKMELYDLLGRRVNTLVNTSQNAGSYKVHFDGKNLASGEYFYRLSANGFVQTQKMMLIK